MEQELLPHLKYEGFSFSSELRQDFCFRTYMIEHDFMREIEHY